MRKDYNGVTTLLSTQGFGDINYTENPEYLKLTVTKCEQAHHKHVLLLLQYLQTSSAVDTPTRICL